MCRGTCVEERVSRNAGGHALTPLWAWWATTRQGGPLAWKINDTTRTRERLNVRPMSINIDAGPTETFDEIGEGFARDRQRYPCANTGQCWTVGIMGDIVVGLIWALLPRVYKLQYRGHLYPQAPAPSFPFRVSPLLPRLEMQPRLLGKRTNLFLERMIFLSRKHVSWRLVKDLVFLWKLKVKVFPINVSNGKFLWFVWWIMESIFYFRCIIFFFFFWLIVKVKSFVHLYVLKAKLINSLFVNSSVSLSG